MTSVKINLTQKLTRVKVITEFVQVVNWWFTELAPNQEFLGSIPSLNKLTAMFKFVKCQWKSGNKWRKNDNINYAVLISHGALHELAQ